jgi:hypothetical protein
MIQIRLFMGMIWKCQLLFAGSMNRFGYQSVVWWSICSKG